MRVTPKTDEEIQHMNLVSPGIYNFEVVSAIDTFSTKGNEMIEVQLKFWDISGAERVITDYLLDKMAIKLKHFAEVTGLIDKYNLGKIDANDCLYKHGAIEIVIDIGKEIPAEKLKGKPPGSRYPDRNAVKDYVKKQVSKHVEVVEELNDDIPF